MVLTRQCADVSKLMYHMHLLVAFDGQLRASVRSMRQRCYKGQFQQPQTVHREQWRCIRSIDTVDNISVNRQKQVLRTGTAQWQDPGAVRCQATHVPMIQKMQKTFEILQVQFIDQVVRSP